MPCMPRTTVVAAARALRRAKRIAITTHVNPDGDGIAAALALAQALTGGVRRIELLAPSKPASTYDFLPGFSRWQTLTDEHAAARRAPVDVLVSVDCTDRKRLGAVWQQRRGLLLNIDHHASNEGFGDLDLIDVGLACTCQLVAQVIQRLDVSIERSIAECLYTGLVYDTGRFMHSNTGAAEFRFAAQMLSRGIDAAALNRKLAYTRSPHDLEVEALALAHLAVDRTEPRLAGIALPWAAIKKVGEPEDWGDLIELPRSLRGVEIAYLARERANGEVRVSLRSNPPFAVAPVAARHDGGGHAQAAGCTLPGGLAAAMKKLLPQLREALGPLSKKSR